MNEFIKESFISLDNQLAAIETYINRLTEEDDYTKTSIVFYSFKKRNKKLNFKISPRYLA